MIHLSQTNRIIIFSLFVVTVTSFTCKSWQYKNLTDENYEMCYQSFCRCLTCKETANYVDVIGLLTLSRFIATIYCVGRYHSVPVIASNGQTRHVDAFYSVKLLGKPYGSISSKLAEKQNSSSGADGVEKLLLNIDTGDEFPHKVDTKAIIWGLIKHTNPPKNGESAVNRAFYYQISYIIRSQSQANTRLLNDQPIVMPSETTIVGPVGNFEQNKIYFHIPGYFNASKNEIIDIELITVQVEPNGTVRPLAGHKFQLEKLNYVICFDTKADEEYPDNNHTVYSAIGCKPYVKFERYDKYQAYIVNGNFLNLCVCEKQSESHLKVHLKQTVPESHPEKYSMSVSFMLVCFLFVLIIVGITTVTVMVALQLYYPNKIFEK